MKAENFGKNLKDILDYLGMTQFDLAQRLREIFYLAENFLMHGSRSGVVIWAAKLRSEDEIHNL